MSGFGNVPTSDDIPGYPLDSIWNEANGSLIPIRGIRPHTDSNGKTTIVVEIAADSGDFATGAIVDLATLLALAGASSDANTVASIMGRLTKIRDLLAATLTISGTVTANAGASSTATLANINASATSVTLFSANASAKGRILTNDSASALYLKYGSTASATSFTYKIPANGIWEMPGFPVYTGIITGIWDTATGNARITELT